MEFEIRRLHAGLGSGRRYHLLDGKSRLQLVADYASPWLPADEANRVRFARSGGQVVASLDLPEGEGRVRNGRIHTSHALIIDHAVYAIINKYQDENGRKPPFFTIEADGMTWLAWNRPDDDNLLTLYKEVPTNLMIVEDPLKSMPIDPVGQVTRAAQEHDFTVSIPVNPLHHADLIMLALVFLVDTP
ncbi:MAG: hypothetical protein H6667_05870 [Ardenticatenaceae bacterium]|nr:hypothetical protein [Ardenticatenaceae bacterium]